MIFSLNSSEKLKKRDEIKLLFKEGSRLKESEVFLLYKFVSPNDSKSKIRCGFSVPKKKFKRAVDRNQLKRCLREGYRLNSIALKNKLKDEETDLLLMFIYVGSEAISCKQIEKKIILLLQELETKI